MNARGTAADDDLEDADETRVSGGPFEAAVKLCRVLFVGRDRGETLGLRQFLTTCRPRLSPLYTSEDATIKRQRTSGGMHTSSSGGLWWTVSAIDGAKGIRRSIRQFGLGQYCQVCLRTAED